MLDHFPHASNSFVFFPFSLVRSAGERPHDKGVVVPLRGVPGAGIHGGGGCAESHHLSGTPLQQQSNLTIRLHLGTRLPNVNFCSSNAADFVDFLKEFEAQQRRASLAKADTIMKELQPQFENFAKVFLKI